MKMFLNVAMLIFAAFILMLITLGTCTVARADTIPKVQLGTWCMDRVSYRSDGYVAEGSNIRDGKEEEREGCLEGDEHGQVGFILRIEPNRFFWEGDNQVYPECKFVSVKRTKTNWPVASRPRDKEDWNPVTQIKMLCGKGADTYRMKVEMVYAKGTLKIIKMLSWED